MAQYRENADHAGQPRCRARVFALVVEQVHHPFRRVGSSIPSRISFTKPFSRARPQSVPAAGKTVTGTTRADVTNFPLHPKKEKVHFYRFRREKLPASSFRGSSASYRVAIGGADVVQWKRTGCGPVACAGPYPRRLGSDAAWGRRL